MVWVLEVGQCMVLSRSAAVAMMLPVIALPCAVLAVLLLHLQGGQMTHQ
jgi:hypothetical protein